MKLKKSDLNASDYPHFYILTKDGDIEHCNYSDALVKTFNSYTKIYDSYESALDDLRYIAYIYNFNDITITYYLEDIMRYIKNKHPVWVIREKYKHGKRVKYIDVSTINYLKFSTINGGTWRLSTQSFENGFNIVHNANSLGLNIYFDKANAYAKLEKLNRSDNNE